LNTLSIRQPWATYVVYGIKPIENRSWTTDYRGPLLIHASAKEDTRRTVRDLPLFADMIANVRREAGAERPDAALCRYLQNNSKTGRLELRKAYRGDAELAAQYRLLRRVLDDETPAFLASAIIGRVDLVDIADSDSEWADRGQYHWRLANPVVFDDPVLDVRGRLRIWDFPIHQIEA
jgi:hypothetical protein